MTPPHIVADLTYTDIEIIGLCELFWRQAGERPDIDVVHRLYHYEKTREMQAHIKKMRDLAAKLGVGVECL